MVTKLRSVVLIRTNVHRPKQSCTNPSPVIRSPLPADLKHLTDFDMIPLTVGKIVLTTVSDEAMSAVPVLLRRTANERTFILTVNLTVTTVHYVVVP